MRQYSAFLLICLVLCSNATPIKNNIQSELQDKNSQFYQFLEEGSQYVVDEVLNLLKNLEDAARSDLIKLVKAWQKEKAILTGILVKATQAFELQKAECNRLDAIQHTYQNRIEYRIQETIRNVKQIKDNKIRIKALSKQRCTQNLLYVDHVIEHRNALLLFNILLKAIKNYKAGSFVELSNISNASESLENYINTYAKQHSKEFTSAMLQINRNLKPQQLKRMIMIQSQKEFSVKKLTLGNVRSLAQIKGKLQKLLAGMVATQIKERDQQAIAESDSAQLFATIKSSLQDESRKDAVRNKQLAKQIAGYKIRLARQIIIVKRCRKQQAQLENSMKLAQKNLDAAQARFKKRKASIQSAIKLFTKLYIYYKERVYNVATKSDNKRIKDFNKNKNFKKTQYKESAAKFNKLDNKIGSYAKKTALKSMKF